MHVCMLIDGFRLPHASSGLRGKIESVRVFFFNDPATTEIYTLSLHDALPIPAVIPSSATRKAPAVQARPTAIRSRSEEHTSELQSRPHLVCRLLLEKKNP